MFIVLFLNVLFISFVQGQDQSGFTSIDCGRNINTVTYTDEKTDIVYESDRDFVNTGVNKNVSSFFMTNIDEHLKTLRSFPIGDRNCYNIRYRKLSSPNNNNNNNNNNIKKRLYMVRASFFYGNYDGKNRTPEFDIYLGVNKWTKVNFSGSDEIVRKEIIHVATWTDDIDVCVVKTKTESIPFISSLEFRPLPDSTYETQFDYLKLFRRLDFGSIQIVRYGNDDYDRIWRPPEPPKGTPINASFVSGSLSNTTFTLPPKVMSTAVKPTGNQTFLTFNWVPEEPKCYVYMHFAEIEQLQKTDLREFDIYLNNDTLFTNVVPKYQFSVTTSKNFTLNGPSLEITLNKTTRATHPPVLNAVEIFMVGYFTQQPTERQQVEAMRRIKIGYMVKENWEGDPCVPSLFRWNRLVCRQDGVNSPIITTLNLSNLGLTGKIDPSIGNLTRIEELILSKNNLHGEIPEFLANLPSLKILDLSGNNLTGPVPPLLLQKVQNGLILSLDQDLCPSDSCQKKKDSNSIVVPIVATIGAVILGIILLTFTIYYIVKRRRRRKASVTTDDMTTLPSENRDVRSTGEGVKSNFVSHNPVLVSGVEVGYLESKHRHFSYAEIVIMTNNFDNILGKGGFGTVYYGILRDNTEVAVKMLSRSSSQGSKEFRAEATLLTTVHHKNLTSLIGYCDEGTNMGLIYEYMVNGNLQWHLSDRNRNNLSWEERLQIAIDAAKGLEYLHDGIKPPVVHRDVKSSNILLDETFNAKLADFGLSKTFPIESSVAMTTEVCGTPGYLDPEYFIAKRLTKKSDIYSFGIVILEIITGRSAIIKGNENENEDNVHITEWVKSILEHGDIQDVVEPTVKGACDTNSIWKAIELGLNCASVNPNLRPRMNDVVTELKECLKMEISRLKNNDNNSLDSIGVFPLNVESGVNNPFAR